MGSLKGDNEGGELIGLEVLINFPAELQKKCTEANIKCKKILRIILAQQNLEPDFNIDKILRITRFQGHLSSDWKVKMYWFSFPISSLKKLRFVGSANACSHA